MLFTDCFSSFVHPQVREDKFPTFIVLTDTSEHAKDIGDALLHHLLDMNAWSGLLLYDNIHTPDVLTTLLPMGKCNKQLLDVPKLLTFHNVSASNQDTVAMLFQQSTRYKLTSIVCARADAVFPVKMRIDTDYLLLHGDIPIPQRRHIFDHFVLQVFMPYEEFMRRLDECCIQGTFLWFCCGVASHTWFCVTPLMTYTFAH